MSCDDMFNTDGDSAPVRENLGTIVLQVHPYRGGEVDGHPVHCLYEP